MVFGVFIFIFYYLQQIVRKDIWTRTTSVTVVVIFLKVSFRKLLHHSYVSSSFSTITRHSHNSILKDTLKMKILLEWINIRANSFIITYVDIMKLKSPKLPGQLSFAQKFESALQRTLYRNRWHYTYFHTLLFLWKN